MSEKELEILRSLLIDLFLDGPRAVQKRQPDKGLEADITSAANTSDNKVSQVGEKRRDQNLKEA